MTMETLIYYAVTTHNYFAESWSAVSPLSLRHLPHLRMLQWFRRWKSEFPKLMDFHSLVTLVVSCWMFAPTIAHCIAKGDPGYFRSCVVGGLEARESPESILTVEKKLFQNSSQIYPLGNQYTYRTSPLLICKATRNGAFSIANCKRLPEAIALNSYNMLKLANLPHWLAIVHLTGYRNWLLHRPEVAQKGSFVGLNPLVNEQFAIENCHL